jgi:hypothetical protein
MHELDGGGPENGEPGGAHILDNSSYGLLFSSGPLPITHHLGVASERTKHVAILILQGSSVAQEFLEFRAPQVGVILFAYRGDKSVDAWSGRGDTGIASTPIIDAKAESLVGDKSAIACNKVV